MVIIQTNCIFEFSEGRFNSPSGIVSLFYFFRRKLVLWKICHNALVSQIQNGVNETLTLAQANGISIPTFAQAISYGGGQNFYLDGQAAKLEAENYTTAFSIENMAKDVNICCNLAKECGVNMPGEENAKRVYDKALENGMAKEDFRATIKVVRGK